ncbi:hypothetical protein [Bradyrhizobium iriomotense]|uniref:Uncharacterized protein n=1 Tax=Bradyrhizobium iriomotense TaxID=441950 RepID=A0ABQ6B6X7_9BRAD|nr:hypothetical protein [Bradyrhizobium iriomotense]GLR87953.1 hypothetical protein GCM10007857_46650 [Bradyrhizobium iriomotense]
MALLMRGALVEYSGAFLGPIPNIVIFQFNPEKLSRTINIPPPPAITPTSRKQKTETGKASAPPTESISVTAQFSAADDLGRGDALSVVPRLFGIAPQLAALEKMVYPPKTPGGLIGAAIDAVGAALGGGAQAATRSVPREKVPTLLFIWGPTRVLPVTLKTMSITEQQFDFLLNPVQAEVSLGLEVASAPPSKDVVANGALTYTNLIKDTQATLNLAKAAVLAVDIIPF